MDKVTIRVGHVPAVPQYSAGHLLYGSKQLMLGGASADGTCNMLLKIVALYEMHTLRTRIVLQL
jgi:hypothetical protein